MNPLKIEEQDMIRISADMDELASSIFKIISRILAFTGIEGADFKYLCADRLSVWLYLVIRRVESVDRLSQEQKGELNILIKNVCAMLGIRTIGEEERADAAQQQETRQAQGEEAQEAQNVGNTLETETKSIKVIIDQIDKWIAQLEEGRKDFSVKPFSTGEIAKSIGQKIEQFNQILERRGVPMEGELAKQAKNLLRKIETASGQIDKKSEQGRGLRLMRANLFRAIKEGAPKEGLREIENKLAREPGMYRNAIFIQTLLPLELSTGKDGDFAWLECCKAVSENYGGLNNFLNQYFDDEKRIWKDLKKYREACLSSLKYSLDEFRKIKENMDKSPEKFAISDVSRWMAQFRGIKTTLIFNLEKSLELKNEIDRMMLQLKRIKEIVLDLQNDIMGHA